MNQVITMPTRELRTVLTGFSKIINKSSSLPALRSVRLQRSESGVLKLHATDIDSFATYLPAASQPGPEVDVLVPLDSLTAAVKGGKGAIELIPESKERLMLRTFVSQTALEEVLELPPVADWPEMPEIAAEGFLVDETFKSCLREALDCSSSDESRYILNGASLDVRDSNSHYLIGTDGRHLYLANSFNFKLAESVVMPNRKFLGWAELYNQENWVIGTEQKGETTWIQIASPRWLFRTRAIPGQYPNWKAVAPSVEEAKTFVSFNPDAMAQVVDLLPRLPGRTLLNKPIRLAITPGGVKLGVRNRETDSFSEYPIPGVVVTGNPVQITLNREYLEKALRMGLSELIITDNLVPVICRNGGRQMIIAPLRPEAEPEQPQPAVESNPSDSQQNPPTTEPETHAMTENTSTTTKTAKQPSSAMQQLFEQVESVKTSLKDVLRQLGDTANLLKAAEKENRATEKEIDTVRATLRSLQKVSI